MPVPPLATFGPNERATATEVHEMGAPSFSSVTGIDTAGRARGSVTCSSSETAAGINLDSAGLYSEILKGIVPPRSAQTFLFYSLPLNVAAQVSMNHDLSHSTGEFVA